MASGLATGTGPAGTLTQDIVVSNLGDVPLSASQVADALTAAVVGGGAFEVRSVTTALTENAGFNGVADPNTLTRDDVIPVGGSGSIAISIGVTPGNTFSSTLLADGTSPIGTNVQASAGASFSVYAFNIMHKTLNETSDGVVPVTVYGTPGMDVRLIDPTSVRLIGVAPLRWELATRLDGTVDLTLKFDRNAIRAALTALLAASPSSLDPAAVARNLLGEGDLNVTQLALADRNGNGTVDIGDLRALLGRFAGPDPGIGTAPKKQDPRYLVLTGQLSDGTPFMGEDTVLMEGSAP